MLLDAIAPMEWMPAPAGLSATEAVEVLQVREMVVDLEIPRTAEATKEARVDATAVGAVVVRKVVVEMVATVAVMGVKVVA